MSNKVVMRIKSAAFLRKKHWSDNQTSPQIPNNHIIANLPVSESMFMSKVKEKHVPTAKTLSLSKIAFSQSSPSSTSEIWRKVHSTRSEVRLKNLNTSKVQQKPVRLNLIEKVDRIKSKHFERQKVYQKNCFHTQKIIMQRSSSLKRQGQKGELQRKILQLLIPFERASKLAEQRYRARLLKIAKH